METRKLTEEERTKAAAILDGIRVSIEELSAGDSELLFAYRRKIAKELQYDERSKPSQRKALKRRKLISQNGKCANCGESLPPAEFGSVLDRLKAMEGYTVENTRLLCRDCDTKIQRERAFLG